MRARATERAEALTREHFVKMTPGKLTGLRHVTEASGRFKVLALDQSNSFRRSLKENKAKWGFDGEPPYEVIRDSKLEICSTIGPKASAVLLDVNYSARQALNFEALPRDAGLIVRLEASKEAGSIGEVEPSWSVAQIKQMGASAVKLLLYLDTEDKETTEKQVQFAREICEECQQHDILLMVEELSFPRKGEDRNSPSYLKRKPQNITECIRLLGPHSDVLKVEFPGDFAVHSKQEMEENLRRLNDVAIRPWVLLSAAEDFGTFVKKVEMAMQFGASGIMVGRAVFKEYFEGETPKKRNEFLKATAVQRWLEISGLVDKYATPWRQRYGITLKDLAAAVDPNWFKQAAAEAPAAPAVRLGEY
jgi:tagatose 1,6-diphosphate aldolase